ncbi:MAG: DUF1836 domain-containing protein [Clostridia bacterium]|nr:DUF1836 domain-containing protein [Clostridia bacterium]
MSEVEERLLAFHCPRWEELPDVELYVDQMVSYIERHLAVLDVEQEGHFITASMINNYVKMKLIPAPVKKRYGVRQLARLMVICSLKRDFSIGELSSMIDIELARFENRAIYNVFCEEMERNIRHVFLGEQMAPAGPTPEEAIVRAVMTAFANKLYAHCIIRSHTGPGGAQVLPMAGVNNS